MILGVHPPGGGRWVDGGGGRYGCVGGVPCTYACTRMCTHACTCMLNMLNMDTSMLAAICNSIHVCVCVRACVCMWGHPPMPQDTPRHPPPTCPLPRAAGSPKHQISITLELIKIIRFCLKILYL